MKHGKNPTVQQKKLMSSKKLNPSDWLVVKDTSTEMVLVHRHFDSTTKVIRKVSDYE